MEVYQHRDCNVTIEKDWRFINIETVMSHIEKEWGFINIKTNVTH